MKRPAAGPFSLFCAFILLLALPSTDVLSQERQGGYAAMEGVTSADVVFDFRVGEPDVALGHLDLIHSMLDNPAMTRDGEEPEIVVVFIGPSVNLVSTDQDQDMTDGRAPMADKISAMEAEGVRFEICMTAAQSHGVSAESILPEIVQVGNGWISLIGYQHNGFAVISDF